MYTLIRRITLGLIISTFCSEMTAKVAPDFIEICPGLTSDCLKDNIQKTIPHFVKGIPSLGVNTTDPLSIDYAKFDLPGGLKVEFSDGNLTGLRKCVVDYVKYEDYVGDFKIHCDLAVKGKYRAVGKVLLFSLDGEGDAKIKAKNVIIEAKLVFEDKVRDGVVYHEAKSIKTDYRFGDKVTFLFTNLIKDNPELSKTILDFFNENWKELLDEFAKPIMEPVIHSALELIRKFFKAVPKNEIIA